MALEGMRLDGLEKLVDSDPYIDFISRKGKNIELDNELLEFTGLLEEDDEVADVDYKSLLLRILCEDRRDQSHKKKREEDNDNCYVEEEGDPEYKLILKCMKEYGSSYAVEYESDGVHRVITYEEVLCSDEEPDCEPGRKLRSSTKEKTRSTSNQTIDEENRRKHDSKSKSTKESKNLTLRKSRNKGKNEMVENVKSSTSGMVPDSDYLTFMSSLEVVDDHCVYMHEGHKVVYEPSNKEKNTLKKEEHDDDEGDSDVEILDRTLFYENMNKDGSLNVEDPRTESQFRKEVTAVLRKPYDKKEHDQLWLDIELRKQGERHLELRNGRERSYPVDKDGKSYLDHHPDLRRSLLRLKEDKPKCLNLLRGFFFWLQHFVRNGSFKPWLDEECLAIKPESC